MAHGELTPRELAIVALIAAGHTAKEIAIELDIAPRTVEKHIDQARLKLRAKNRIHMITIAVEMGLLPGFGGRDGGETE
jgi:LuxR family transcriptional regulator of spore coat protein